VRHAVGECCIDKLASIEGVGLYFAARDVGLFGTPQPDSQHSFEGAVTARDLVQKKTET
jgi:hypothetical protein